MNGRRVTWRGWLPYVLVVVSALLIGYVGGAPDRGGAPLDPTSAAPDGKSASPHQKVSRTLERVRDRAIESIEVLKRQTALGSERSRALAECPARIRQHDLQRAALGLLQEAAIARVEVFLTELGEPSAVDDETRRPRPDGEHPGAR